MRKPNLVFMHGEDSFSLHQELKRWREMFIDKYDDTNLENLDGSKASPKDIAAAVNSMPFLAEKRLVILKDFMASNKADVLKKLIPVLEGLPETTVLVIAESSAPDKRSSLFKWLNKEASPRLFAKPKGMQLSNWIMKQAKASGGNIDSRAANYLVNAIGDDMWKLAHETHKLSLFAQGKQITAEMIDALVTGSIEHSIFTMTDQLAKRDISGAMQTMRKLQAQGQEGPYIFAMIARQFRLMLEMKSLSEERMPNNVIAQKMGVHPYVVQTTIKQCRNFTHSQLKRGLRKLLEIDKRLKTGGLHLRPREEEQYLLAIERVLLQH